MDLISLPLSRWFDSALARVRSAGDAYRQPVAIFLTGEPAMKIQVRTAFLIWLLAVVPLATILAPLPTAAAGPTPYCPQGLSYDSSTGACQGTSTCPSGYNNIGQGCTAAEVGSCPAGTSSSGGGVCQGLPSCPLGSTLAAPSYVCAGPPPEACTQVETIGSVDMC